jgi:hypothetical protein
MYQINEIASCLRQADAQIHHSVNYLSLTPASNEFYVYTYF